MARLFCPAPRFRLTAVVTLVPKQLVRLYIKLEILLPKLMELSSSVPNFMASRLMSQKPTDMAMLLITEGMPTTSKVRRAERSNRKPRKLSRMPLGRRNISVSSTRETTRWEQMVARPMPSTPSLRPATKMELQTTLVNTIKKVKTKGISDLPTAFFSA